MKNLHYLSILAALAMASCQATGPRLPNASVANNAVPPPTAPVATKPVDPVNGNWVPTGNAAGLYTGIFKNNVFVSKSPQNKVLAKGSYTLANQNTVNLKFQGAATKTVVNATCLLSTPTIMTCTPTVGSSFTLHKTT